MCRRLAAGMLPLSEMYGPAFGKGFNPLTTNITTGKKGGSTHHCPDCKKPPTRRCYYVLHLAFCEECGERFAPWSKAGCAKHTHAQGFNLKFKGARDNWPASKIRKLAGLEDQTQTQPVPVKEQIDNSFVPPFIGRRPSLEDQLQYGLVPVTPIENNKWRIHHEVLQPPSIGIPSVLRAMDRKAMKQARAAMALSVFREEEAELLLERQAQAKAKAKAQNKAAAKKMGKKGGKAKTRA